MSAFVGFLEGSFDIFVSFFFGLCLFVALSFLFGLVSALILQFHSYCTYSWSRLTYQEEDSEVVLRTFRDSPASESVGHKFNVKVTRTELDYEQLIEMYKDDACSEVTFLIDCILCEEPDEVLDKFEVPYDYTPQFWDLLSTLPGREETRNLARNLAESIIEMDFMYSKSMPLRPLVLGSIPYLVEVGKVSDDPKYNNKLEAQLIRLLGHHYTPEPVLASPIRNGEVIRYDYFRTMMAWGLGEVGSITALQPLRELIWNSSKLTEQIYVTRVSIAKIQQRCKDDEVGRVSLALEDDVIGLMSNGQCEGQLSIDTKIRE